MDGLINVIVLVVIVSLIYQISISRNKRKLKKQKEEDIREANRRRNYIATLSERQIIQFAKEKGMTELSEWINYKRVLSPTNSIKYEISRGWNDDECIPWAEVKRKSDNKVIFPRWDY